MSWDERHMEKSKLELISETSGEGNLHFSRGFSPVKLVQKVDIQSILDYSPSSSALSGRRQRLNDGGLINYVHNKESI